MKDLSQQPVRAVPKFKERRPKKTKKMQQYRGVKIPSRKVRGQVDATTAYAARRLWGDYCLECGSPYIELHHVMPKGMSQSGRGVKTNLVPLCAEHHRGKTGVHSDAKLMRKYKDKCKERFNEHYFRDKYDLWKMGLIERPTTELYEKFMKL